MMALITTVTVKLIVLIAPVQEILPVCSNSVQIILTGEAVKPIPAATIAEKKGVMRLRMAVFTLIDLPVKVLSAVGTKRKKPVRSGRKILRKNSSTDLNLFLKGRASNGPALCSHFPHNFYAAQINGLASQAGFPLDMATSKEANNIFYLGRKCWLQFLTNLLILTVLPIILIGLAVLWEY